MLGSFDNWMDHNLNYNNGLIIVYNLNEEEHK